MKLKFIIRITQGYFPEGKPIVSSPDNDQFVDQLSYVPVANYNGRKRALEKFKRNGEYSSLLYWIPLEYIKIN